MQAKVDAGPVSPDDMRVAREMKDANIWDEDTVISATGIDDAYAAHPNRFVRGEPLVKGAPAAVWINPPSASADLS